tara:strand:- start:137 stop:439 length:303 start_codon:yes stop_codon:yes gene_type:complete
VEFRFRLLFTFNESLSNSFLSSEARGWLCIACRGVPPHNKTEITFTHFDTLTTNVKSNLSTQDVDSNDFSFPRRGATALTDTGEGASHLLVAFFLVRKAA